MASNSRIGVIGGGSWATALAKILSEKNEGINWWMRNPDAVDYFKRYHHNPNYLRAVEFDVEKIYMNSEVEDIVERSDILIVAVPSAFLSASLEGLEKKDFEGKKVFCAIK